ncbi:TadE family type IV pilus minor pilin [Arthrobacter glacialis]|uniref:TadE family type IV pilus minor pilin n=1 Tax=Arthrobacter glacialis TaxID=1664 RepID=UPI001FAFEA4F|nr:TadE family type IV pilus minor pilin [Arthrobacter glacialis]
MQSTSSYRCTTHSAQPHRSKRGRRSTMTATRGSVTAEIAVVLPAITALLAMLLLGVSAGMLQLRLEEGARAGARALARGDAPALVLDLVSRVAGEQASVSLSSSGAYATVTVYGKVDGVLSGLVPWMQSAQASARVEKAEPTALTQLIVASAPLRGTGTMDSKTSLWRWVKAPHCQFSPAALCAATTIGQWGGHHDYG